MAEPEGGIRYQGGTRSMNTLPWRNQGEEYVTRAEPGGGIRY